MANGLRRKSWKNIGLLGGALLGIGAGSWCLATSRDWFDFENALRRDGVSVAAEIVALPCNARPNAGGAAHTGEPDFIPHCEAIYRFTDPAGETRQVTKPVSTRFHAGLSIGDHVPITYLPVDPTVSEIEPGALAIGGYRVLGVGALLGFLGLLFGYAFWRSLRSD